MEPGWDGARVGWSQGGMEVMEMEATETGWDGDRVGWRQGGMETGWDGGDGDGDRVGWRRWRWR